MTEANTVLSWEDRMLQTHEHPEAKLKVFLLIDNIYSLGLKMTIINFSDQRII